MGNKTLCDWQKEDIKTKTKKLKKIVGKPQFYCKACARVASKAEYLCKPEPLQ